MGCGELISSGKVKIKQDVEIKRFLNNGIIFSDDSEIEADAVILAFVHVIMLSSRSDRSY